MSRDSISGAIIRRARAGEGGDGGVRREMRELKDVSWNSRSFSIRAHAAEYENIGSKSMYLNLKK